MSALLRDLAHAVAREGGRALLVGGSVRDELLGLESKDLDVEVYGLPLDRLEVVLGGFGEVVRVGRSFGVLRVKGLDADISIPRRDSKWGRGHRGFIARLDPDLDYATAARRRDLTINSIARDPLTGEILDPHGGRRDLERRVLRATDPEHFVEDPLRGLRVAQFIARFEMAPDEELERLCSGLDLSELPGERQEAEFRKLLLRGRRPSLGLEFLRRTDLLRFYPELLALVGVPQDPEWHPEGTVWEHTMLVVDEAAASRVGDERDDLVVGWAALCHDLGKPATTETRADGRICSPRHEEAGVEPTERFLSALRVPGDTVAAVVGLVRYHLAPICFVRDGAKAGAYRRLARRLEKAGAHARLLTRLARADHFGRGTPDALRREFPQGDEFLRRAERLGVEEASVPDVVMGRHLIERGWTPGPDFGPILERCRAVQDDTGWDDPDRILDRVLE